MFNIKNVVRMWGAGFLLWSTANTGLAETQPKFTIQPLGSSQVEVAVDATASVVYRITNNLSDAFPLMLDMQSLGGANAGISQVQGNSATCTLSPFTLAAGASCLLSLEIDGSKMGPSGSNKIFSGPRICIDSGSSPSFSCSQPAASNALSVRTTSTPPNLPSFSVSGSPLLLPAGGGAGSLTITNNSATETILNIRPDLNGTPLENNVTVSGNCSNLAPSASCTMTFTSGIDLVSDTTFPIKADNALSVSAQIRIFQQYAYITDPTSNAISICELFVNTLGICSSTTASGAFSVPAGMVLNPSNSILYVANGTFSGSISICPITNNTITACTTAPIGTFSVPSGLAISPSGAFLYVVNYIGGNLSICPLNTDGSLGACTLSTGNGTFTVPSSITLNSSGTIAYITNQGSNTVSICPINIDGSLGTCTTSSGNGVLNQPIGITFNGEGTFVYIVNPIGNTINTCPVNSDGSFGFCTTNSSSTFNFGGTAFYGLATNNSQPYGYFPSNPQGNISICPLNTDGSLGTCTVAGSGLGGPTSIILTSQ